MPIYEYRCEACEHVFEALVRAGQQPACSACGATALERLVSLFAVDSEGTRQNARERSLPKKRQTQFDREVGEREEYERHRH
jgi:putative FmdB family regulatory protein